MNIQYELQAWFAAGLRRWSADYPDAGLTESEIAEFAALVRRSGDPRFGDYQMNGAMPLGKRVGRSPRDVAAEIVARLPASDRCGPPEIAGPGFINVRLHDEWLISRLAACHVDERLGVTPAEAPRRYIVDFSAPNVAKPMHVGHIRSTVIGDALCRILRFLGHRVTSDNHIGDWGTQFGMIIYGFRHFAYADAYADHPVDELARLYRLVNQLVDYHQMHSDLPTAREEAARQEEYVARETAAAESSGKPVDKKAKKKLSRDRAALAEAQAKITSMEAKLAAVQDDAELAALAQAHPDIATAVLRETARLHQGDADNLALWREFLPPCLEAIEAVYRRLGVTFDHTLGESFYHDRLAKVVEELRTSGIAQVSDGAVCVFLEGYSTPMIIQKQDGAFLYATTDLATIEYRMEQWSPDAILYVVDHRQSLHFEQLFATARRWRFGEVEFQHVGFGTVLGSDGRPFKTRSGDTVGLSGLLDEAVQRAGAVVSENDESKPGGPELSESDRLRIAEIVGIGALKYADLSQNRESDYVFSYDKMLAMNGNTATYMQYAYARVRSIFRRGEVDAASLRATARPIQLAHAAERALAVALLRFSEALDFAAADYRPNQLTNYLFELANDYSTFFEQCPVLKAETPEARASRLVLCDVTARTLKQGLELLGIETVEQM